MTQFTSKINSDNSKVVIEITLDPPKISSSGKSFVLGTSNGFKNIPGTDLELSFNIIRSTKPKNGNINNS